MPDVASRRPTPSRRFRHVRRRSLVAPTLVRRIGYDTFIRFADNNANDVTYTGRLLETNVSKKSIAAGRLVDESFGTRAIASDPCQTTFARFFSYFSQVVRGSRIGDNTNVNVVPSLDGKGAKWLALTEMPFVWKFDPESLDTEKLLRFNPELSRMFTMTAHPHASSDGGMYNIGIVPGARSSYAIFKTGVTGSKYASKLVCSLPVNDGLSYYHSFGITDRYFIFVESPLKWSLPKLALWRFHRRSFDDCMYWINDKPSRFRIVDRETNKEIVNVTYEAEPFFSFHHVNAFEDDVNRRLVVDMVCYRNGKIAFNSSFLDELNRGNKEGMRGVFRRFFLPLNATGKTKVESEVLSDFHSLELPRINGCHNGRPYRFAYGLGLSSPSADFLDSVVKLNTETKETRLFAEKGTFASEPVFVRAPDSKSEDDGVILSVLLSGNPDEKKPFLVILDAASFKEIARAEVTCRIPTTFHGNFMSAK
ncbi:retinoid isomerohydrolase-like [Oscarella lobularis]|uniref:retinoid isomerohydrolase-like n=1 Tax=Oscarella lobularis TaxID=121494 RepID=UPI00331340B4